MDEWQSKQYNYAGLATMKLSVPASHQKTSLLLVLCIMLNNGLECSYLFNYRLNADACNVLVSRACQSTDYSGIL